MAELTNKERELMNELDYLKRHNALLQPEIDRARDMAVPGKEVTILDIKRRSTLHKDQEESMVRRARIKRVVNHIIELDNGLSCTLKEYALYLRDPSIPLKER